MPVQSQTISSNSEPASLRKRVRSIYSCKDDGYISSAHPMTFAPVKKRRQSRFMADIESGKNNNKQHIVAVLDFDSSELGGEIREKQGTPTVNPTTTTPLRRILTPARRNVFNVSPMTPKNQSLPICCLNFETIAESPCSTSGKVGKKESDTEGHGSSTPIPAPQTPISSGKKMREVVELFEKM